MSQYAVLYNETDGPADRADQPLCLLFETPVTMDMSRGAQFLGAKKLLEELDGGVNHSVEQLLRWTCEPRIVRLEWLCDIKDDHFSQDALKEIRQELKANQDAYRAKEEKEREEREYKLYLRLKKKFEPPEDGGSPDAGLGFPKPQVY